MQTLIPAFLFGFIALVLFGVATWLLIPAVREFKQARASRSWPSVPGKIVSASVVYTAPINTDMDSRIRRGTYRPVLEYDYEVNGKSYRANHRVFGDEAIAYGTSNRAEAIIDDYPAECAVQVYYDPTDPGNAVLLPGRTGAVLNALVAGAVCLGVSLFISWADVLLVMAPR